MNEQYQKNVYALDGNHPRLAAYLGDCLLVEQIYQSVGAFEIVRTDNRQVSVLYHSQEGDLPLVSKKDPVRAARIFADSIYHEDHNVFIVFGLGCGYYLSDLLARLTPKQHIICVIPDKNLFLLQLMHVPLEVIFSDDRVNFCMANTAEAVYDSIRLLLWKMQSKNFAYVRMPVYERIFSEYANMLSVSMKAEVLWQENMAHCFSVESAAIKKHYFNQEGQMGDLFSFFERIEKEHVYEKPTFGEQSYLFIKELFYYKSYDETGSV